jgi:type I restriction enzyme M protein
MNNNKKERTLNGRKLRDRTNEILFMDLRTWDQNIEEYVIDKGKKKKKTILSSEQINKVKEIYQNWQSIDCLNSSMYNKPELYRSVCFDEIQEKNFALAPSNYIEFVDRDLNIDYKKEMKRIQKEMAELIKIEKKSQKMLEDAFEGIGYGIDKI